VSALIWVSITAVTIAVVGGVGFALHRTGILHPGAARPADVPVATDEHYLVYLSQIEVEPTTPGGGKWDVTDGGPDVRYDVYWRGNRVFRSSVQEDTLVARWDQEEVGIHDLLKGISPERSVKAARITATRGETIEFRVVDNDALNNDDIGSWQVPVDSLHTGEQVWNAPAPGIKQAICRVERVGQSGR
jgi:hypothetical protein